MVEVKKRGENLITCNDGRINFPSDKLDLQSKKKKKKARRTREGRKEEEAEVVERKKAPLAAFAALGNRSSRKNSVRALFSGRL